MTLAAGSVALDHGDIFANVNDGFKGAKPDLGALELGCPIPVFGVRADGDDETNEVTGCVSPDGGGTGADAGLDGGADGSTDDGAPPGSGSAQPDGSSSGCGCGTARTETSLPWAPIAAAWGIAFAALKRRARRD